MAQGHGPGTPAGSCPLQARDSRASSVMDTSARSKLRQKAERLQGRGGCGSYWYHDSTQEVLITLRGKKRQHFGKVGLQKSPAWFSFRAKNYSKEAKGRSAPWEHVQERVIYSRVYNTIWDTRVRNVDLLVIPGRKDACIHAEFTYTLGYIQIMSALRYTGCQTWSFSHTREHVLGDIQSMYPGKSRLYPL